MTKKIKFIENYNGIDYNNLIEVLSSQDGISITPTPDIWNLTNPEYLKIYDLWKTSKFNMDAIKWINYYPKLHFQQEIIDQLAIYLKVVPLRSWVSRIDPGYFAPWHWDIDDNEVEFLKQGYPKRFSIFIEPPVHGHIFVVDDDYLFNEAQGNIYQWNDYKDWHSGINAGMTPKYMLHLLAI
jgi:hypothetical protein